MRVCEVLGAELELALFCLMGSSALDQLAETLVDAPVARVLVFSEGAVTNSPGETSPGELVALVQERFGARLPTVAGTDLNFCELNRTRPDLRAIDGVAWPMTPQVHAFDDASIIETPETQAAQAATAHHFAPGRRLFVGPVTLLPRYNPNVAAERAPSPADRRQATLLGAAFTLSSIKQLSDAGVDAVTYYETVGPRGVVAKEPVPPAWERQSKHRVFPLFHILADAAGIARREVLNVKSSRPLRVTGLAARGRGGTTLLIANTTPTSVVVELAGTQPDGAIRRLNASTAGAASLEPAVFRSAFEPFGGNTLNLGPYETARIDFAP
jgi:hypothetical protein